MKGLLSTSSRNSDFGEGPVIAGTTEANGTSGAFSRLLNPLASRRSVVQFGQSEKEVALSGVETWLPRFCVLDILLEFLGAAITFTLESMR